MDTEEEEIVADSVDIVSPVSRSSVVTTNSSAVEAEPAVAVIAPTSAPTDSTPATAAEPVKEVDPEPVKESTPEPVKQSTTSAAPVDPTSEPIKEPTPAKAAEPVNTPATTTLVTPAVTPAVITPTTDSVPELPRKPTKPSPPADPESMYNCSSWEKTVELFAYLRAKVVFTRCIYDPIDEIHFEKKLLGTNIANNEYVIKLQHYQKELYTGAIFKKFKRGSSTKRLIWCTPLFGKHITLYCNFN